MSVGLKQSELMELTLRDISDLVHRCDEFVQLVTLARRTGGRYGRAERMIERAHDLDTEIERLRAKARGDSNQDKELS